MRTFSSIMFGKATLKIVSMPNVESAVFVLKHVDEILYRNPIVPPTSQLIPAHRDSHYRLSSMSKLPR